MVVAGVFTKIIFHNLKNNFLVASFRLNDKPTEMTVKNITISGICPDVDLEFVYELNISEYEHWKYGPSYRVEAYKKLQIKDNQSLVRYLASRKFVGIGTKKARLIVGALGDNAIPKIIENPDILIPIGISAKDTKVIFDTLVSDGENTMMLNFFIANDLSMQDFNVFSSHYKPAEFFAKLNTNPYQFIYEKREITFRMVDLLATKNKFINLFLEREQALIYHLLFESCYRTGNTYILVEDFYNFFAERQLLNYDDFLIAMAKLHEQKHILVGSNSEVQPFVYYRGERYLCDRFKQLLGSNDVEKFTFNPAHLDAKLDRTQIEAIKIALESSISIISGSPGTGKTTIISELTHQLAKFAKDLVLLAPTGRAAKQIAMRTQKMAMTIHKFLRWDRKRNVFEVNEVNPDTKKILIIDEFSMVNLEVFVDLLKGLPFLEKIVIIGDADQLPSIEPGELLHDFIVSKKIPATFLNINYRQAEGSTIIDDAYKVINNQLPSLDSKDAQGHPTTSEKGVQMVVSMFASSIRENRSILEVQVLCPIYQTDFGINRINAEIQKLFSKEKEMVLETKDTSFFLGDKVIQIENNYEQNVYNGDLGILTNFREVNGKTTEIEIDFAGNFVWYPKELFAENVRLGYAISVHKAQGSEFEHVLLALFQKQRFLLNKNLLYTAMTRAKKRLDVFMVPQLFKYAIKTSLPKRLTKIQEYLN